jgi:Arc/MetJ family transcription regulator
MRTSLVIDGELLAEALRIHGGGSKRAVVEAALRTFVEVNDEDIDPGHQCGRRLVPARNLRARGTSLARSLLTAERTTTPWVVRLGNRIQNVRRS